jgi:hypothetical protein
MPVKNKVYLGLVCPYCGFKFDKTFNENGKVIVTCRLSDGGCNKVFVIDVKVNIILFTYKLELARLDTPSVFGGFGHQ